MAYVSECAHFTVNVTSGFISDWQWAVHAAVDYRIAGLVDARKSVEAEARLELMTGISRESRLGRERGARTVIVLVTGDPEIAGFFRGLGELQGTPRVA